MTRHDDKPPVRGHGLTPAILWAGLVLRSNVKGVPS